MMYTGKNVTVACLDTGIYPHIDFDNRILFFRDFIADRKKPYDDNGHGTHVAGIIGGSGAASEGRVVGQAPGCSLVSLKILDHLGNGSKEDIMKAYRWLLENFLDYHIRIVNISVGTTYKAGTEHAGLVEGAEELWDAGMVVVAAAGNGGPKEGSVTAPGCCKKIITIGSSDLLEGNSPISGRGPTSECICKPDLVAPGRGILSCLPGKPPRYGSKSGTSMSTPLVSGAIACMLEKKPMLTNVDIKMMLKDSAVDLGYSRNVQGWGKFDRNRFMSL